jgi:predicted nucleotidyltransferase
MVPYQKLFLELASRKVSYLVAGGFAVNFHQVLRATVDLDLILHLEKSNILLFVEIMKEMGFEPRVPIKPEDFAEAHIRQKWIKEKGMMVLSFIQQDNPFEVIDVFVQEPKPFSELFGRKLEVKAFGTAIPVIGKLDLIAMKREAGRDKDIFDVKELEKK